MHGPWDEYLHHENVARFERLLGEANDEQTRNTLRRLLAEELASAKRRHWLPRNGGAPPAGAHAPGPADPAGGPGDPDGPAP